MAKGVYGHLGLEEDDGGMHDGDKIGQAAVDGMIRTKNKTHVNLFPEGQALIKLAHALGTRFSYKNRRNTPIISFWLQVKDQPDEIRIKVYDLNTARVATQHSLLRSKLHLNCLLRLYMSVHSDTPQMAYAEWDSIA
jgi:hypothetical protein